MKLGTIIFISIILLFSFLNAKGIKLQEAISKKYIECYIKGNSNSTHYIKPLKIKFKNLKGPIEIEIENGQIFSCNDSSIQDVIVTQSMIVSLKKEQSREVEIFAMCIEENNAAPNSMAIYKQGTKASPQISKMTQFIEEKKYFNQTAQRAIWAIVGNKDLSSIYGYQTDGLESIIAKAAEITGKPIPPKPKADDYIKNYENTSHTYKKTMEGYFEVDLPTIEHVKVAMFNDKGIIVRELYNNPNHPTGYKKIQFKFDSTYFTDSYYVMKIIVGGEVFIERKFRNTAKNE